MKYDKVTRRLLLTSSISGLLLSLMSLLTIVTLILMATGVTNSSSSTSSGGGGNGTSGNVLASLLISGGLKWFAITTFLLGIVGVIFLIHLCVTLTLLFIHNNVKNQEILKVCLFLIMFCYVGVVVGFSLYLRIRRSSNDLLRNQTNNL